MTYLLKSSVACAALVALSTPSFANSISIGESSVTEATTLITPKRAGQTMIEISFKYVDPNAGAVIVDLFDSQEGYESNTPIGRMALPARAETHTAKFENLGSVYYAYRAFQDSNGNRKLDVDSERYLMQGRATAENRAQSWGDAKIYLPQGRFFRTSTFYVQPEPIETTVEIEETLFQGAKRLIAEFSD